MATLAAVTPPVAEEYVFQSRLTVWMSSGRVTDQKPASSGYSLRCECPVHRAFAAQPLEHLVRRAVEPQLPLADLDVLQVHLIGLAARRSHLALQTSRRPGGDPTPLLTTSREPLRSIQDDHNHSDGGPSSCSWPRSGARAFCSSRCSTATGPRSGSASAEWPSVPPRSSLLMLVRRERFPTDRRLWPHCAVAALSFNTIAWTLFAYGEQHITSIMAGLWNATDPALGADLRGRSSSAPRRPTGPRVAGLIIGFAGVATLLGPWRGLGGGQLLGHLACAGAAACYGVGFPYTRRHLSDRPESGIVALGLPAHLRVVMLAPFLLLAPAPTTHIGWDGARQPPRAGRARQRGRLRLQLPDRARARCHRRLDRHLRGPGVLDAARRGASSARRCTGTSPPARSCCSSAWPCPRAGCRLSQVALGFARRRRQLSSRLGPTTPAGVSPWATGPPPSPSR